MTDFKTENTLQERYEESRKIRLKYPDRIPCIVECEANSKLPQLQNKKFLIPNDLTVSHLSAIVRSRISLEDE